MPVSPADVLDTCQVTPADQVEKQIVSLHQTAGAAIFYLKPERPSPFAVAFGNDAHTRKRNPVSEIDANACARLFDLGQLDALAINIEFGEVLTQTPAASARWTPIVVLRLRRGWDSVLGCRRLLLLLLLRPRLLRRLLLWRRLLSPVVLFLVSFSATFSALAVQLAVVRATAFVARDTTDRVAHRLARVVPFVIFAMTRILE